MYKRLFLLMGLFAALAINTLAQTNNFQAQTAIKLSTGTDVSDPWGLLEDDDDAKRRRA